MFSKVAGRCCPTGAAGCKKSQSFVQIGVLKSRGESRLGGNGILKDSLPEDRCPTFANFVSFCSNFFCFLLCRFFAAFCEPVRDKRKNACEAKVNSSTELAEVLGPTGPFSRTLVHVEIVNAR